MKFASRRSAVALILLIVSLGLKGSELPIGASIPEVKVLNQKGDEVDLSKASAEGWSLVYFYPKADTPGCTKQACSLRDAFEALSELGVKVFGVSGDDVASQKAFADKFQLPFDLLADTEKEIINAFGVPARLTFAKRQAYLFKDGKLVWRDLKASTDQQAADVLAVIEKTE